MGAQDNCCFSAATCCFLGPVISAVKVAMCIVPVFLIIVIGCGVISLALLPFDIAMTYYTIAVSPRIGKNVTVLSLLLAIVPLLLFPPLVFVCAILGSIVAAIVFPTYETYAHLMDCDSCAVFSTQIFKYTFDAVQDFLDFNYSTYFEYLAEKRTDNGYCFEINFLQIFTGLILAILGMVIDGIAIAIICSIKVIPAIFRFWYELSTLWASSDDCRCFCFVPYIISLFAVIPLTFIGYAIALVAGVLYGSNSSIVAHKNNNFTDGLKQIFKGIYEADVATNELIFGNSCSSSLFECFNFHLEGAVADSYVNNPFRESVWVANNRSNAVPYAANPPPAPIVNPAAPPAPVYDPDNLNPPYQNNNNAAPGGPEYRISIARVWDNFFETCRKNAIEAIARGICKHDDIEAVSPNIVIGLPSLVILHALYRSRLSEGIVLADGLTVDENNRPTDFITNSIYPAVIKLKWDFIGANITDFEFAFIEKWLLSTDEKLVFPQEILIDRQAVLKGLSSKIQSMATDTTRIPTFKRLFAQTLQQVPAPVANAIV